MIWSKGFTSSYYAYILDPATWRETTRLQITGGSIVHSDNGLRDSADIDVIGYEGGEEWIRVYLDTEQDGAAAHIPLFTGLTSSPERNFDGEYETNTLQCYSVLKPAQDILLERGYYAPAEIDGTLVIRDLLQFTPARLEVNGEAPSLQKSIIAEDNETALSMIDKILSAMNWRMRIKGDGVIELCPQASEESATFDPLENDAIQPSIDVTRDWYDCPNVLRAIQGDLTAIARDDNPDSPLSIPARKREIWAEESNVDLNSGEGIAEYAVRRLKELQRVSLSASYSRRFHPEVLVGDIVRLHYPVQGLDGLFKVTEQKIEIAYGAKTDESVEMI